MDDELKVGTEDYEKRQEYLQKLFLWWPTQVRNRPTIERNTIKFLKSAILICLPISGTFRSAEIVTKPQNQKVLFPVITNNALDKTLSGTTGRNDSGVF